MTLELLAMLGGGVTGFVMKLIGAQSEAMTRSLELMIQRQGVADESADRAYARSGSAGVWVRRGITCIILFAVVIAPFILAFTDHGVTLQSSPPAGLIGFLKGIFGIASKEWETVQGFVLLPEVRQGLLAILGFYFGSSQIK